MTPQPHPAPHASGSPVEPFPVAAGERHLRIMEALVASVRETPAQRFLRVNSEAIRRAVAEMDAENAS